MPAGFLKAIWFSLIGFLGRLFRKSPSLPMPVTARSPKVKPSRPTSGSVRVAHQRANRLAHDTWGKEPSPLKRLKSSPISSTARSSPVCRSRSATPKRAHTDPEYIFHPPPSPFPNISLSGIFATPPLSSDVELARLSPASPSEPHTLTPVASPGSPSPFRGSNPSLHTLHTLSPCTPRTPSSAVIVHLDRSTISPTTMSDGSLEVISLGDRHPFPASPVKVTDFARLPSPWSPMGKSALSNVWMSVDGMLVNATGRVVDTPAAQSQDRCEFAPKTSHMISLPHISTSLYSSPSALDALGISVFGNLDDQGHVDTKDDSSSVPKLNQVRDENHPIIVTPRKRRDTLPSVSSHGKNYSVQSAKRLSTPMTKLDNAVATHVRSATSISSMAYELRMGLFADGRSITAFENIISLLDQASPESIRVTPHRDATYAVVAS